VDVQEVVQLNVINTVHQDVLSNALVHVQRVLLVAVPILHVRIVVWVAVMMHAKELV
jgi:hypothetical protein